MPQATPELRARWDGPGDEKATKHLDQNFTLTRAWEWRRKDPKYVPTEEDLSAIEYMCEEWDYGGLEVPLQPVIELHDEPINVEAELNKVWGAVHGQAGREVLVGKETVGENLVRYINDLREEVPMIASVDIKAGAMTMTIEGAKTTLLYMASALAAILEEAGSKAPNYIQYDLQHQGRSYSLVLQRAEGKTPHQLRKEAEAERDAALKALQDLVELDPNDSDEPKGRKVWARAASLLRKHGGGK